MTAPRPDDMQDYINAANKMGADDVFYERMSQCIDNYEKNMVCGADRVIRPSIRRRVTTIAAAAVVCCVVGLTGYRFFQNLEAELPAASGRSELDLFDSTPESDPSIVWESLKRQLADAERRQREHEAQYPQHTGSSYQWQQDYAQWEKTALQLQNEIAVITEELCLSNTIMIASSFWDTQADQIRLYLINGTDQPVTLPQYYQLTHETQEAKSGSLYMINKWSLPVLDAHSSMEVFCHLGISERVSDLSAVSRDLKKGTYQLRLCETPDAETDSTSDTITVTVSLQSDDSIRTVSLAEELQLETNQLPSWSSTRATIEKIQLFRQNKEAQSTFTDAELCEAILNYVIEKNGGVDVQSVANAETHYDIYYLTEDGSAYICHDEQNSCYSYMFEYPQTGEIFRGSLLTIGTLGEQTLLNAANE